MALVLFACVTAHAADVPREFLEPSCVGCAIEEETVRARWSADEWARLLAGEVLTTDGGTGADGARDAEAVGVIDHAPAVVWRRLADFEGRKDFIDNLVSIAVERVDGKRVWLRESIEIMWIGVDLTVINTLDPAAGEMRWVLDEEADNDIRATSGYWRMVPIADGKRSLVTYKSIVDSGRPVPGFVQSWAIKRALPAQITALREALGR